MRVFVPVLWERARGIDFCSDALELAVIVPRVGERRRVYLDKYEKIIDGQQISCIWSPPLSEINGWDGLPGEIAFSYLVSGTAVLRAREPGFQFSSGADPLDEIRAKSIVVDIDVRVTKPLMEALEATAPDAEFKLSSYGSYNSKSGVSTHLWLESGGANFANVAGYTYLWTRRCETMLEALVRITDEQMIIAFHRYRPPIGDEVFILNNVLGVEDRAVIERAISNADPIEDVFQPYLI